MGEKSGLSPEQISLVNNEALMSGNVPPFDREQAMANRQADANNGEGENPGESEFDRRMAIIDRLIADRKNRGNGPIMTGVFQNGKLTIKRTEEAPTASEAEPAPTVGEEQTPVASEAEPAPVAGNQETTPAAQESIFSDQEFIDGWNARKRRIEEAIHELQTAGGNVVIENGKIKVNIPKPASSAEVAPTETGDSASEENDYTIAGEFTDTSAEEAVTEDGYPITNKFPESPVVENSNTSMANDFFYTTVSNPIEAPVVIEAANKATAPEVAPEGVPEAAPEATSEATPEAKVEATPGTAQEATPEAGPKAVPEGASETTPTTPEATSETKTETVAEAEAEQVNSLKAMLEESRARYAALEQTLGEARAELRQAREVLERYGQRIEELDEIIAGNEKWSGKPTTEAKRNKIQEKRAQVGQQLRDDKAIDKEVGSMVFTLIKRSGCKNPREYRKMVEKERSALSLDLDEDIRAIKRTAQREGWSEATLSKQIEYIENRYADKEFKLENDKDLVDMYYPTWQKRIGDILFFFDENRRNERLSKLKRARRIHSFLVERAQAA